MKIVYTLHALEKFKVLEAEGWKITKNKIRQIIKKPKWQGTTKSNQETAMSLVDEKHIIRIVLRKENQEGDIIRVITFHIGRRGKYETTL